MTTYPKGIPQRRQRTPQEGQYIRPRGESTRALNRVGSRILPPLGKPHLPLPRDIGADFSQQCLRQIFFLLSAFNVLPGSGSYTVNLIMLFLSVRWLKRFFRWSILTVV